MTDIDPWGTYDEHLSPQYSEDTSLYDEGHTYDDVPFEETFDDDKKEKRPVEANSKITATLKGGAGFEAPWIVVHGETVNEVSDVLQAIMSANLLSEVADAAKAFRAASGQPAAAPAQRRPAAQNAAPTGGGKQCAHGEMVFRTGQGAKGPWSGHFCPTPKGTPDQCKPIFV